MGKIFVCEKGEGKWESYILLIINQLENDSRIITLSKYKDCSYSLLFACNSKPIPIEATLHKEMNSTKRKTLRVFPYFVVLECLFYLKKKKLFFLVVQPTSNQAHLGSIKEKKHFYLKPKGLAELNILTLIRQSQQDGRVIFPAHNFSLSCFHWQPKSNWAVACNALQGL